MTLPDHLTGTSRHEAICQRQLVELERLAKMSPMELRAAENHYQSTADHELHAFALHVAITELRRENVIL